MKDTYTPVFPRAVKLTPEISDVSWSPQNLLHPQKSIIALVTSSGAVVLAALVNKSWISIYEFTPTWAQIIEKDLGMTDEDRKFSYESLRDQLDRLLVTTIAWSCLHYEQPDKCFAYFVTAHRNSEIVIWKVHRVKNDITSVDQSIDVELKFKKKLIDQHVKINTMLWVHLDDKNYLLVVGYFNGPIGVLKLQEFEGGITCSSYSTCYAEEDGIPVDYLRVSRETDRWLEIVAVKGMHVLVMVLDVLGKMISTKFVSSPGFSITGKDLRKLFLCK